MCDGPEIPDTREGTKGKNSAYSGTLYGKVIIGKSLTRKYGT
jgi:hypothetical protein